MECHRKIHLEWFQGSTDWVYGLRGIKTGGFDRVRGNVELGLVIKERLGDRYKAISKMLHHISKLMW